MRLSGRRLLGLAQCAAVLRPPADTAQLTLKDPYWDRVSVEIVITKRADCDSRARGLSASSGGRAAPQGVRNDRRAGRRYRVLAA